MKVNFKDDNRIEFEFDNNKELNTLFILGLKKLLENKAKVYPVDNKDVPELKSNNSIEISTELYHTIASIGATLSLVEEINRDR